MSTLSKSKNWSLQTEEYIALIFLFSLGQKGYPLKFQPTSEWQKGRDRLLQRDLMPTNKHVRLKNKLPDEVLTFLQKSDGKFKKEDFDPGHLRLLQNTNEEQTSAALAYLLDMMNKHNPRERGLPMNKWIGGVLRKWIKNTT